MVIKDNKISCKFKDICENLVYKNEILTGMSIAYGNVMYKNYDFFGTTGDNSTSVDEDTLIDIASITKLFTTIIMMYLVEKEIVNLDKKVGDYSNRFINLKNTRIGDILSYREIIKTENRIGFNNDVNVLKNSIYNLLVNHSYIQQYSDMPTLFLGFFIEEVTGKSLSDWIIEFLLNPLELKRTYFFKTDDLNVMDYTGEMNLINDKLYYIDNKVGLVHDPKARAFAQHNIFCGHAGILISTRDIVKIFQALLNYSLIKKKTIYRFIEGDGWIEDNNRQSFGYLCYRKFSNKSQSEIYEGMSKYSMAYTGFTGTYTCMDFENSCFVYMGGNRVNNRITKVVNGEKTYGNKILIDGHEFINSSNYVYQKDILRDELSKIVLSM